MLLLSTNISFRPSLVSLPSTNYSSGKKEISRIKPEGSNKIENKHPYSKTILGNNETAARTKQTSPKNTVLRNSKRCSYS